MGAGNPTISRETETQVPAACQPQPRQPHIIKLISQLQKPTRRKTDTWIIDTGKRETRYQLVKVHQTIRQPHRRGALIWSGLTFSALQFSCSVMSDSLWPHGLQQARPPCPSPTPRVYPNPCPFSRWYHPTISSLSSPSPPTFNLSQRQGLFKWVSSSHQVAKVLEFQLQCPSDHIKKAASFLAYVLGCCDEGESVACSFIIYK